MRWPEKRALDAGGPGARGKLGEARRSAANPVEARALAGEAQTIGAGRLLSLRAPAGEVAYGEAALLRPNANRGYSELRRREGKGEVPKEAAGMAYCCRER